MENNERMLNDNEIKNLASACKTDYFTASLLMARGIKDPEEAKLFLYGTIKDLTSPYAYKGMREAVEKIEFYLNKNSKIVFYGDYDCDGTGALAILLRSFGEAGADVDFYVPIRSEEGYGLNKEAIKKIKDELSPALIVTADCGITSCEEVGYAKALGMDIIVTDHHRPGEILPDCIAVNPCFNPELTPLCGAGVAFFLARALFGDDLVLKYADICSVSTIADIVPLVGDNRLIVKAGLELIRKGASHAGIKALTEESGVFYKRVTSYDIAFKIAPRINATGRLAQAHSAVNLLFTDDITEARFIAKELSAQNSERQEIGNKIFAEASEMLKSYDFGRKKIIVLFNRNWAEGVIGIAAARITEYYYLPCILLTESKDGFMKGSARSIQGANIHDLIKSQEKYLRSFGGHAMAAGLSLSKENFTKFFDGISEETSKLDHSIFERKSRIDLYLTMKAADESVFATVEKFQPFGYKNPAPVFCDDSPSADFRPIGKSEHIKASLSTGQVISFGNKFLLPAYKSAQNRQILYTLDKNYFNGKIENQFKVKQIILSEYHISDDILISGYLDFCQKVPNKIISVKKGKKSSGNNLHIFFDMDNFENFIKKNPEITRVYRHSDNAYAEDVAVLNPDADFPYHCYGAVFFYEDYPEEVIRCFSDFNIRIENNKKLSFPDFSIDNMRSLYLVLRKLSDMKIKYNTEEIFMLSTNNGCRLNYTEFLLYFYIMTQVGLIIKGNSDILYIDHGKKDLSESFLYRYIDGKRS